MTTQLTTYRGSPSGDPEPDGTARVDAALQHLAAGALTDGPLGRVGLELELHLVDRAAPGRRPTWAQVLELTSALPPLPSGSSVTLEPGGQVELSTPPGDDVVHGVAALQHDERIVREAFWDKGFGLAPLGADPARRPRRVNPGARYVAMEQHFDASSTDGSGLQMMTSTAALQVNLDAGPAAGWPQRLALVRRLVPVLVAVSSTSPWLGGRTSGWHSMRQGTWHGIDAGHGVDAGMTGLAEPRGTSPTEAFALDAVRSPLVLVPADAVDPDADPGQLLGVTERLPLERWLRGQAPFVRPPTTAEVDYHLTTLFPTVRLRGYLELRCLDAVPDRWWPALAATVTTLVDDPVAADQAFEVCAPVARSWESAARVGLADPAVRRAATALLDLASRRAPTPLRAGVEALAELTAAGRTLSEQLRARIEAVGPERVLLEESDPHAGGWPTDLSTPASDLSDTRQDSCKEPSHDHHP